jgi:glycerol kinase
MNDRLLLLAIDQGTTSSRVLLFDRELQPVLTLQRELPQSFPRPGWVEHDAHGIAVDVRALCTEAMDRCRREGLGKVVAAGLTNQRETVVLWERATGRALHPAIVWQDRRTAAACAELRGQGHEDEVRARTGLVLDPYFSATKVAWLLDQVPGARERAKRGELACGTIDCWLAWQLSGGTMHVTEATNASRTLLWNLRRGAWDEELLELFDIPAALLPEVRPSSSPFGMLRLGSPEVELPLLAMVGDQQAAALSQGCLQAGASKCTYGTGAFFVQSTGGTPPEDPAGLLSTALLGDIDAPLFALEGAVFAAGASVQWLRDGLGLFEQAADIAGLAAAADDQERVYMVPAFAGLGAPHWEADARGLLCGLTRGSDRRSVARAALEAGCFRTLDLLEATRGTGMPLPDRLAIDGGMARNDWFAQRLADLLDLEVARPDNPEATARGAAMLAGRELGWWPDLSSAPSAPMAASFAPRMDAAEREDRRAGWEDAVAACKALTGGDPS